MGDEEDLFAWLLFSWLMVCLYPTGDDLYCAMLGSEMLNLGHHHWEMVNRNKTT